MRAAVIGTGRMGRRHIQVIQELGLALVGICDCNPEALAMAAEEQRAPRDIHFADPHLMLSQTKPECVIVSTTASTHCEYTCLAAEAGARYIFCEKPMAVSLEECDRMIATCQAHGVRLAINHQMRFMEQYTEPKHIVQSEAFGGLSSITVVAGNFGMAMNGTHYFEMFRYMTDEEPAEVTAWFSPERVPNPRGAQFEDRAGAVRLTTSSGKRFYMEISADQGHGMKVIYAGPYGQLVVDELAGTMVLSVREEQYLDLPSTRYGMPWVETLKKIEPADAVEPTRAVLDALLRDENPPTGQDGRLAVAAVVAAYVSDENGHISVRLDDTNLPLDRTFPWA